MRVAVAATPSLALPTLEWILTSEHQLELVITRVDKPVGRGRVFQESKVAQWATSQGIPTIKPNNPSDLIGVLSDIEVVITLAYGVILPESVLRIPRYGFLNIHFSLLPAWRGAAPVQRGIENGDRISGITVFQLDAGMDTGPIYIQDPVVIEEEESAGELLVRLAARAPYSAAQALSMIADGFTPIPQDENGKSLAPKISKGETRVNWKQDALLIDRRIRAFSPLPGCWTQWRGSRINLTKAKVTSNGENLPPGRISISNEELIVGCANGSALQIVQIQPSGKRAMKAEEWLNGARFVTGDCFD